jgi:hypothetical protein
MLSPERPAREAQAGLQQAYPGGGAKPLPTRRRALHKRFEAGSFTHSARGLRIALRFDGRYGIDTG